MDNIRQITDQVVNKHMRRNSWESQPRAPKGSVNGGQWITKEEVSQIIYKHLQGKHDQKTHGRRGGSSSIPNKISSQSSGVATEQQAVNHIIRDTSYGANSDQVYKDMKRNGIEYVYGYHLTRDENIPRIETNGIKMSSQDNRRDASYVFLDIDDAKRNSLRDALGYQRGATVVQVKIPAKEAATMRDDGFFNGTFDSYSAARYFDNMPREWIVGQEKLADLTPKT